MSMARVAPVTVGVRWHRLSLQGFGPYQNEVSVHFPEGMGVLVAPNEAGKSTLVCGLMAVLYGLRSGSATEAFGQARFRHWHGASRFQGEVELTGLDGLRYAIQRRFETHQVKLIRIGEKGPEVEIGGTHNPGAHRRNETFERRLQEILGLTSREMFATTFCVMQPLPEMRAVHDDVQALLSGAGAGSYSAALERLSGALSEVTRTTGDRGVTPRNGTKDRRLESLRAEISALEQALVEGRAAADALQATSADLNSMETERAEVSQRLSDRKKLLSSWNSWREAAARYRTSAQRRSELRAALERAREQADEVQRLEAQGISDAPGGPDEKLEKIAELTREVQGLAEQGTRLRRLLMSARKDHDEADESLSTEYSEVRERSDLLHDLGDLHDRVPRIEALEADVGHLTDDPTQHEALAKLADFGRLGRPGGAAVSRLFDRSRDALRVWRRHGEFGDELARLDRELVGYSLFEDADSEFLDWIRAEPLSAGELQAKRDASTAAREKARERTAALEAEMAAFQKAQADVANLDDSLIPAMESKVHLLEKQQRGSWEVEQRQLALLRALAWRVATFVVFLGLMFGSGLAMRFSWKVSAPVGVVVALLAATMVGRSEVRTVTEMRRKQKELADDLKELNSHLGVLANMSVFELGALRQRRAEYLRALPEMETRIEHARGEAEAVLPEDTEREKRLRPLAARYGCVSIALEQWQQMKATRAKIARDLEKLAREEWGDAEVARLLVSEAAPGWPELGRLADLMEPGACVTVAELCRWLESRSNKFWDETLAQADAWETLRANIDAREKEQARAERSLAELERLRAEVARLRERCTPFNELTDLDIVRTLFEEAREVEKRLVDARAQCTALEEQLAELDVVLTEKRGTLGSLRQTVAPGLETLDEDVEAMRARLREHAEGRGRLATAREALHAVLAAFEADSLAALAARVDAAEDVCVGLLRDLETSPTGAEGALDPLAGTEEITRLERELEQISARLDELDFLRQDLAMREARLQGRDPLNVAEAEIRLEELRADEQALASEARVLTLAWRELKASVETYQSTHRERLESASTAHFERITGRAGRRVRLDEGFEISLLEADGTPVHPSQLSQGAQDQVYLSLRLAIADLVAGNLALPFIFDDPFLNCDADRLEMIRETLQRIAADRQVLVFTHRQELQAWGAPVWVEDGLRSTSHDG